MSVPIEAEPAEFVNDFRLVRGLLPVHAPYSTAVSVFAKAVSYHRGTGFGDFPRKTPDFPKDPAFRVRLRLLPGRTDGNFKRPNRRNHDDQ